MRVRSRAKKEQHDTTPWCYAAVSTGRAAVVPLCPPRSVPAASPKIQRVQGRGGAHCVGSKPFSSAAAGAGVAGVKSMGAGAASSSAFSSMRSLWSLRTPHAASMGAAAMQRAWCGCRGVRALVLAKRTRAAAEPASRGSGSSARRRQVRTPTKRPAAPSATWPRGNSLR